MVRGRTQGNLNKLPAPPPIEHRYIFMVVNTEPSVQYILAQKNNSATFNYRSSIYPKLFARQQVHHSHLFHKSDVHFMNFLKIKNQAGSNNE